AGGKSTSATSANYTATIPFTFNGSGSNAGTIASGGIASGNGSSNNYTVSASPPGAAGVSFVLGFPGDTAQTISLGFGTYDSSTSSLTQMADATDQVSVSKFTQNGSGGGVYDPKAWAQASVQIDSAFNVAYGVTSTQTGFQQLIAGMQLIQQAATSTDSATYQKDMTQAATLLSSGLTNIQSYHSKVAAATNAINEEQTTQNTDISNLQTQLSNIQQVDLSTVGTQLNIMQTQLQASYAATATLAQLSILKYL
ncbi:MAG TPA: flagellin, partial [Alphaproteobacteria bacterium]|nr:flagellin [Alphaproteobacteria bacterium]